jgi:acetoin utilization protein AcuB
MQRHKIHHLPVVSDGRLVGVVSQRDLLIACSFLNGADEDIQVSMVMTKDVLTVSSTAGVVEVARKMLEAGAGSAVVMSGEAIAGVFTTVDALNVLANTELR